ncbi:MAG TPA: O-antigen ligase family protein, partial [Thermoanaerobaculia bacterium]|nr:O-antigen ligase family protein [Thermoanaerobaculia bacterium]
GRALLQRCAFFLLLMCVAVAPFPYGGVLPAGTLTIELFAFAIATLALLSRTEEVRIGAAAIPLAALVAIALLGAFQTKVLPQNELQQLSPASARVYADANSVLQLYGRPAIPPAISIAPVETKSTILLTFAYAALLVSSMILANTRERRRILAGALLLTTTAHVLFATLFRDPLSDRLHGAFVNPDHMAGYLGIALAFAFGLIWSEVLTSDDRTRRVRDRAERLERRAIPLAWRVALWATIAAGIVLTRSRGGFLAALFTTFALVVLALLHGRGPVASRRARMMIGTAIMSGLLIVGFTTGENALLRFLASDPRDIGTDTRVQIWHSSIDAWRMFPAFGSGLGTFREAFRRVQTGGVVGLVEQAHNDFLQLLVTGGWIGGVLGVCVFASMFVILFRAWMRQPHREESAFILAAIGALLSLTIHGIVEFNMSIPAIPATLAVMAGAAWAARDRKNAERFPASL